LEKARRDVREIGVKLILTEFAEDLLVVKSVEISTATGLPGEPEFKFTLDVLNSDEHIEVFVSVLQSEDVMMRVHPSDDDALRLTAEAKELLKSKLQEIVNEFMLFTKVRKGKVKLVCSK